MNLLIHVNAMPIPKSGINSYKHLALLKYLLTMKLFIVILILSFNVSATGYSQKIDLTVSNAPLRDVMQQIRKQTGFNFIFASAILEEAKPVSLSLKQATIEEAMITIFKEQPFIYQIRNTSILIKPKAKTEQGLFDKVMEVMKILTITGKVTDEEGHPLPGATVILKEANKSTSTDGQGQFIFQNVPEKGTILIRMIGRETREIKYKNGMIPVIILKGINTDLKEVVINKGYYKEKNELNTGSVGIVKGVDIQKQPVSDPLMALEGRIPGLYVSQATGVPGGAMRVNIRGRNSISNGVDPLYIVNGIPFNSKSLSQLGNAVGEGEDGLSPFTSLRPEDIESIDVLKDADATAIYGSRGANGVILITTKRGKQGRTKLDLNIYRGTGQITGRLDLMNTDQYLEMRKEAFKNDNRNPNAFAYDINGTWDQSQYTDWQEIMIGGMSNSTNANTSLSGGNELTQFLLSLGYRKETTVFPGDFSNQIGSGNLNVTHKSENKKFLANYSANYTNNSYRLPTTDFTQYIYTAPNAPAIYDAKGQLNWDNGTFNNPFSALLQKSNSVTENLITNLDVSYKVLNKLQVKVNIGYNSIKLNEKNLIPFVSQNPLDVFNPALLRSTMIGSNAIKTWILEPQINYSNEWNNHHLDILVGSTFQDNNQQGLYLSASGFANDELLENIGAATQLSSGSSYSQYRYNAIFARIGYNYLEKYVLNLTGRRDGSSKFGPGKQFGNFGAIGAAWLFSKEKLISDNLRFLSLGKLRGSIGRTGNDQISDYKYLSTYIATAGYFGVSGLNPYKLANPFYGWETINKVEAALELGFLKDRLLLNASVYRNRTKNQLVGYNLPGITGFDNITANLPAIIENKGLEIDIRSVNILTKKFSWTISANFSLPKNKLVSYPNIEASSYYNRYAVGQPLSIRYLYKSTGIDPNTGIYTFEDLDKTGSINTLDRYPVFTGRKFFGGLDNTFNYKGLSLDVFFQFVKQKGYSFQGILSPGRFSNLPKQFLDRWKTIGDQKTFQRYVSRAGDISDAWDLYSQSDAAIVDASFVRLKNISLSWQLPFQWVSHIRVQNVRIYIQGQNLATITKFDGVDPETQTASSPGLAPLKVITAGLKVSL